MTSSSSAQVSIIIACYNGSPFLQATLESAVRQTHPPLEVILIDDGSTDDSAAIALRFGSPVRVIRQENQGESVARNRGIAEARGTHVLFLDADDLLGDQALSRLAAALAPHPQAVALMGCARFTETPEQPLSVVPAEIHDFFPYVIDNNFGPPHCWMAPLAIVRTAGGFNESMRWSEDWDLVWRMGLYAEQVVPVDYVGAFYRQHAKSQFATNSMANRCRGHAEIMTRMIEALFERTALLDAHGERLLWGAWTALTRARAQRVGWNELSPLTDALTRLATSGPPRVRRVRLAQAIRIGGPRIASWIWRG